MGKEICETYPGPIRWGFKKLRLNVPIHWVDANGESPCGSSKPSDITTHEWIQDVTCSKCRTLLEPKDE